MTDRNLRIVTGIMAVLLVVVVSWTLFIIGSRNNPSATAPTAGASLALGSPAPSGSAGASAGASQSAGASPSPSASPSADESPTPSPVPTPSPTPTAPPAPLATLTFVELKLDATADPAGQARTITFTSDGRGTITALLTSISPQGTTHMCLQRGTAAPVCKDSKKGTVTATTTQAHVNWRLTVQGVGIATPTVNVKVTFPALSPKVKISHARFNGTADSEQNGIQARFVPRTAGQVHLVADWGGHPFTYEVDLFDQTSGGGGGSFPSDSGSTNVDVSYPVTAKDTWRILVQNTEAGFGPTDMSATIGWP